MSRNSRDISLGHLDTIKEMLKTDQGFHKVYLLNVLCAVLSLIN